MTLELAPRAEAALNAIAQSSGVSAEIYLNEWLPRNAEWLTDQKASVERARADDVAGRVVDHDELFDRLEREYADYGGSVGRRKP